MKFINHRNYANADRWIVMRESPTEAPNYFVTNDLKNYTPITDLQPQKKYNWMTAELIRYETKNSSPGEGMLFKPESFDEAKKYPVIVNYYETKAFELFDYRQPAFTRGDLNIPWFVSRGYIVFVPGIHYETGKIGPSAYNYISGGVRHISKFPWIDVTRIGLQGHSFGGYQTCYMITHDTSFAAAVASSPVTNLVAAHGELKMSGGARLGIEAVQRNNLEWE